MASKECDYCQEEALVHELLQSAAYYLKASDEAECLGTRLLHLGTARGAMESASLLAREFGIDPGSPLRDRVAELRSAIGLRFL